jgi:predicted nucleic acid-binding protein
MSKRRGYQQSPGGRPALVWASPREFWQYTIRELRRGIIFIDTGAILPALDPRDAGIRPWLTEELVDRLVTSTYVVHETIRRLVKPDRYYPGPVGKQNWELALHFLKEWLVEFNVAVICIPENVFNVVQEMFERQRSVACDLTDVSSLVIVRGIEQDRIISPDGHFRQMGLTCYP